ncbi:hypothetical protein AVEN_72264-1 [Araneus ventricosus]|uniref:Uncharacterized protein n=1 Tax=Araneus ventricosus TaxID=182803 RepID=A0A4Y2UU26_ARAVE|nr:hypothetical protein AVEN_72264-1 [Araneus ventricosus]
MPRLPKEQILKELKRHKIWISDLGDGCPKIEMFLGSDVYSKVITGGVKQLKGGLTAVNTKLDRVRKQLESPYEGPFPVIERKDKYFTINIKGKNVNVSLDRLKPAYVLAEDNPKGTTTDHKLQASDNKPDLTQKQSRTGRTIRLPVRFKD